MDPARALLHDIVDYAGLFPPTAAPMQSAVAEYARQRATGDAWMLAAFVVGAGRLGEFAAAAAPWWEGQTWPLSVLLGPDPLADLGRVEAFLATHGPHPASGRTWLRALEFRPSAPVAMAAVLARCPRPAETFCELPWDEDLRPWLEVLAPTGARAKLRCGGVTPELIPPPDRVAGFLRACQDAGVGMKFTAGLHHPVRSVQPLTYEPGAPRAMMHGFLNVFVAATLVHAGDCPDLVLLAVLEETDPSAFRIDAQGVAWRDHQLRAGEIRAARAQFARSFGSCSFAEPVRDLQQLGMP